MGTCKTCNFWENGLCELADYKPEKDSKYFGFEIRVLDDSGLEVKLKTGPDFGCVNHKENKIDA